MTPRFSTPNIPFGPVDVDAFLNKVLSKQAEGLKKTASLEKKEVEVPSNKKEAWNFDKKKDEKDEDKKDEVKDDKKEDKSDKKDEVKDDKKEDKKEDKEEVKEASNLSPFVKVGKLNEKDKKWFKDYFSILYKEYPGYVEAMVADYK